MKNKIIALLAIAGVAGLLASTNPSKPSFKKWLLHEAALREMPGVEPNPNEIYGFVAANPMLDQIFEKDVQRTNYVVFSTYSMKLNEWPEPDTVAVGIFGKFFVVRSS